MADRSLCVVLDAAVAPAAEPWLPLFRRPAPDLGAAARISVYSGRQASPPSLAPPQIRFYGLQVYQTATGFSAQGNAASVQVDLSSLSATIYYGQGDPYELYSALTLASALLLNRMGRALVHAAGVVDPSGRAWLLVGDAHAGKSTTCASLVRAGWRYLSDDQVVIGHSKTGQVIAEGWPRPFHLDAGWPAHAPTGQRESVHPQLIRPDSWVESAPLAGVLLPSTCQKNLAAWSRTELIHCSGADRLSALIRQSPWLLAEPRSAPAVCALLSKVATFPVVHLQLARDTFARGDRLAGILMSLAAPLCSQSARL